MRIFLAGGISGNLNGFWHDIAKGKGYRESMRIFLAGCNGRWDVVDESIFGGCRSVEGGGR